MAEMLTCARCSGQFPGPGVTADEQIYCCDVCATGGMMARPGMNWLGVATAAAAGALLGWWIAARS
ncbi:MAG: hypothetical protein HY320_07590 [Armatimonadetes bacterium]|nr:hypothetical protein [Armatimonadota bacterium]